jgi:hypothetical protein
MPTGTFRLSLGKLFKSLVCSVETLLVEPPSLRLAPLAFLSLRGKSLRDQLLPLLTLLSSLELSFGCALILSLSVAVSDSVKLPSHVDGLWFSDDGLTKGSLLYIEELENLT